MINMQMIELLIAFSVALWALLSKTPIKALVKLLATRIHIVVDARWPGKLHYDDFERYIIQFFAALIALVLIGLAQVIDMAVVTDNLSSEWQWLNDAELVSAAGVISLIPVKYSLLYYLNLALTVALISVVGSAGIHRLEKWISGNALLFDVLRQWLLDRGQATEISVEVISE